MNAELYPSASKNFSPTRAKQMLDAILIRDALDQPITLVNSWGALIANRYLEPYGNKAQTLLFSDQVSKIKYGKFPFPILTAVSGYSADFYTNRDIGTHWFEFTPYLSGSCW